MGSTPTQVIQADLNGTGTLVDITSYVDLDRGIKAATGRTAWTSETPRPGTLTFALDNGDGRFTPGNTATYAVGLTEGTLVEWGVTIGTPVSTIYDSFLGLYPDTANEGTTTATWVQSGGGSWLCQLTGGQNVAYVFSGGTATDTLAWVETSQTDLEVSATIHALGSAATRRIGLIFRMVDSSNYWAIRVVTSTVWAVVRVNAGVVTTVYTSAVTCAAGQVLSAVVSGTQLTASVDGVPLTAPITMADHLTGTRAGLFGHENDSNSMVNDFTATWGATPYERVRRYRAGIPALDFTNGAVGGAQVSVTCYDALATLARRKMRMMLDEVAFTTQPEAYWPLDDSGSGVVVQCDEVSGKAEAPLTTIGPVDSFGWNSGVGPRTDGRSAVIFNPDADSTTVPTEDAAYLTMLTQFSATGAEHEWECAETSGSDIAVTAGLSFWMNIRDIYGTASSGTGEGPYVILFEFANMLVLWRIDDHDIVVVYSSTGGVSTWASCPALTPGETHHVFLQWSAKDGGALGQNVRLWVNGVDCGASTSLGVDVGEVNDPVIEIGGHSIPGGFTSALAWGLTGADKTIYGYSGTIACVSVYGGTGAVVNGSHVPQGYDNLDPAEFYAAGMTGSPESADARFERLGGYLARSDIAFVPQGTAQPITLGPQKTEGQPMLAAMCDALRFEEAVLDTETLAGVDTVRAWLCSENRPETAAVSIDVEQDGAGVPTLSYDASGVAVLVEAKGYSTSVTFKDTAAPDRWADTSATVQAATDGVDDLRALAQYRAQLGRTDTLVPTRVTVDAVNSKADITEELLGLRPLQRVELTGLPSTVLGYASTDDVFVVGVTERHTNGRSMVEVMLAPGASYVTGFADGPAADFEFYTYSGNTWPNLTGAAGTASSITNSQTTIYLSAQNTALTAASVPLLDTALTVPLRLIIDSEELSVTAIAAQVVSGGTITYQALTVTRAQAGTTAAAHTLASQTWSFPTIVGADASF